MLIVGIIIMIAVWAIWVEYASRQDPDYKQEAKTQVDPHWPFPSSKRP